MNNTESAWRKASYSETGNCAEVSAWRKASYSKSGNCAEIGAWRKSARSQGASNCAEVGTGDAVVGIRDTKEAYRGDDRTVLEFSRAAWAGFLGEIRNGR